MPKQQKFTHDVFISFSEDNEAWVKQTLEPGLELAGLTFVDARRSGIPGVFRQESIGKLIEQSRTTLLVLSRKWLRDQWAEFEGALARTLDPAARLPRVLPLLLEKCDLPLGLAALTSLDMTDPARAEAELERLVRVLSLKTRIFISYLPALQPDERLVLHLAKKLEEDGHRVYRDDLSNVNKVWGREIEQEIEQSDFFIIFLSETSVRSKMLINEIKCAYDCCTRLGWPRLLPVRVKYNLSLPRSLEPYIDSLSNIDWLGRKRNINSVKRQLLDLITANLLPAGTKTPDKDELLGSESIPVQPILADAYTPYEQALDQLLERVKLDAIVYEQALAFQQRLTENIAMTRLYGDTENRRADRAQLIGQLNSVSLNVLETPFLDLSSLAASLKSITVGSIQPPEPNAEARAVDTISAPGGTILLGSQIYIERSGDMDLIGQLKSKYGTITTIRAPRQTGKSSMLVRGVAFAQKHRSKVVFIDLQLIDHQGLNNIDEFFRQFVREISRQLSLSMEDSDRQWQELYGVGAIKKMTEFMEDYILPRMVKNAEKMVMAIDEADILINTPFCDEFFGMLRAWYNGRALKPIWNKFHLLMVISTEPTSLIRNQNQSPFNVGLTIHLEDFNLSQVMRLVQSYGLSIEQDELSFLLDFLNGHPYLTSQALYTILTKKITYRKLESISIDDRGPFGEHLGRYLSRIKRESQLAVSLRRVIKSGECTDENSFLQLSRIGLIKGDSYIKCDFRCKLYRQYFENKLS